VSDGKSVFMGHESPIQQRLQITFGKFDALRYTSTLDLAKVWERVLRRAGLPLLYTEGFNTRPRIQLATALPLGISSECEILDVSLREILPTLDGLIQRLEAVSPPGLKVYRIDDVPVMSPPLQTLVKSAEYIITFGDPISREDLQAAIDQTLSQERIIKVIEGKRRRSLLDLRPLIYDLQVDEAGRLWAHLSTGERGNMRIEDLLEHMNLGEMFYRAHRTRLHLDDYAHHTAVRDRLKKKKDE